MGHFCLSGRLIHLFFIVLIVIIGYLLAMIGFFIKKSFFDGWDNFFSLILQNLIYIAFFLGGLTLVYFLGENMALFYLSIVIVLLLVSLSLGGTAEVTRNFSCYSSEVWRPYIKGIKRNIKHSLFFFLILLLLFLVYMITIPFYSSMDSGLGIILSVVMIWVTIFFVMALPYYFALMTMLPGDGPVKTLKKSFIISFDNPGRTLFLLLHIIFDSIISIFTVGLIPGISGIMLSESDMMKLLMKKYDFLEANPDKTKKDINWDELLQEEKDNVGVRTLKGMIFPWK